jgi:hypothetical protein
MHQNVIEDVICWSLRRSDSLRKRSVTRRRVSTRFSEEPLLIADSKSAITESEAAMEFQNISAQPITAWRLFDYERRNFKN